MTTCPILRQILGVILSVVLTTFSQSAYGQEADPTWQIDQWESFYEVYDLFGDPDDDGLVNYVEFGFGLNPTEADASGNNSITPTIRRFENGGVVIGIWQPHFPAGNGFPENAYGRHWFWINLQSSTDLLNWTTIATKPGANGGFESYVEGVGVSESQISPARHQIEIFDTRTSDSGVRYYRLVFFLVS